MVMLHSWNVFHLPRGIRDHARMTRRHREGILRIRKKVEFTWPNYRRWIEQGQAKEFHCCLLSDPPLWILLLFNWKVKRFQSKFCQNLQNFLIISLNSNNFLKVHIELYKPVCKRAFGSMTLECRNAWMFRRPCFAEVVRYWKTRLKVGIHGDTVPFHEFKNTVMFHLSSIPSVVYCCIENFEVSHDLNG